MVRDGVQLSVVDAESLFFISVQFKNDSTRPLSFGQLDDIVFPHLARCLAIFCRAVRPAEYGLTMNGRVLSTMSMRCSAVKIC